MRDLQPRAERDRDPDRHEQLDQRARRACRRSARNADRDGRPRPGRARAGALPPTTSASRDTTSTARPTPGFTPCAGNRIAQPTATSYIDTGLAAGTYYYRVTAEDAAGNVGPGRQRGERDRDRRHDAADRLRSRRLTAGATVAGTVDVTCERRGQRRGRRRTSSRLDGANLGAEDTAAPYRAADWDTLRDAATGRHTLTAVARDGAGNTTTSASVATSTVHEHRAPPGWSAPGDSTRAAARRPPTSRARATTARSRTRPGSTSGKFNNALSFNGTNSCGDRPRLGLARPDDRHDGRGMGQADDRRQLADGRS